MNVVVKICATSTKENQRQLKGTGCSGKANKYKCIKINEQMNVVFKICATSTKEN